MELLIPIAVLVCVFLLNFLTALRDWLLPRIHGEVQGAPVRAIRGVAVAAARLVRVPVVVDAETVDNLTACLLRRLTESEREILAPRYPVALVRRSGGPQLRLRKHK